MAMITKVLSTVYFEDKESANNVLNQLRDWATRKQSAINVDSFLKLVGVDSSKLPLNTALWYWPDLQSAFQSGEIYVFSSPKGWRIELPTPKYIWPGGNVS